MKKNRRTLLLTIAIFLILITITHLLIARPGGGHSYSSGSYGSSSGGSGDGIGLLIYLLFELLPPYISIPLIIIILIAYNKAKNNSNNASKTLVSSPSATNYFSINQKVEQQLHILKQNDPNFSRVLFLDFVSSLYTKFYAYRHDTKLLTTLTPFISEPIFEQIKRTPLKNKFIEIVIGNIFIKNIQSDSNETRILVEINANMTRQNAQTDKPVRLIVTENWLFVRNKGIISAEPERMQTLTCPACGAPAKFTDSGYCEYCNTLITPGKKQWFVRTQKTTYTETLTTKALTSYAYERGTDLPTIYSPSLRAMISTFTHAHSTDWQNYQLKFFNTVKKYFYEIYKKWSDMRWEQTRHLLTDRLWTSFNFWIKEYQRYGYRNILEDTKITKIDIVKIELDKFYEAITVRIYASAKDYIINQQGTVIAGYNKRPRIFSEYWTFIRRSGVEKDDFDLQTCPNCGAPIDKIGQNGICGYCGAKITTGNFSWVVAIITQDEEYKG